MERIGRYEVEEAAKKFFQDKNLNKLRLVLGQWIRYYLDAQRIYEDKLERKVAYILQRMVACLRTPKAPDDPDIFESLWQIMVMIAPMRESKEEQDRERVKPLSLTGAGDENDEREETEIQVGDPDPDNKEKTWDKKIEPSPNSNILTKGDIAFLEHERRGLLNARWNKTGGKWDYMRGKDWKHPLWQLYAAMGVDNDRAFELVLDRLPGRKFSIPSKIEINFARIRAKLGNINRKQTGHEELAKQYEVSKSTVKRYLGKPEKPILSSGMNENEAQAVLDKENADLDFLIRNFAFLLLKKK
jgi:hypothetical protein